MMLLAVLSAIDEPRKGETVLLADWVKGTSMYSNCVFISEQFVEQLWKIL